MTDSIPQRRSKFVFKDCVVDGTGGDAFHIEGGHIDLDVSGSTFKNIGGHKVFVSDAPRAPPPEPEANDNNGPEHGSKRKWWADLSIQTGAAVAGGLIVLIVGWIAFGPH